MPYLVDILPEKRLAVVRGKGQGGLAETLDTMRDLAARPEFPPGFGLLVDMHEQEYVASFDDLLAMRDAFGEMREAFSGPIAVVVPDLLRYGITRTISGLTGMVGVRIEAFRDAADAEAWLALELR